jgi:hypothetical protein
MATFVLVHGGGHTSWHWHLLRPRLAASGEPLTDALQASAPSVPLGHGCEIAAYGESSGSLEHAREQNVEHRQ